MLGVLTKRHVAAPSLALSYADLLLNGFPSTFSMNVVRQGIHAALAATANDNDEIVRIF